MIVTLQLSDRRSHHDHPLREFTLGSESSIDVGRTSKDSKKNLLADVDNALFDCPIMSRRHAHLSTATEDGEVSLVSCKHVGRAEN